MALTAVIGCGARTDIAALPLADGGAGPADSASDATTSKNLCSTGTPAEVVDLPTYSYWLGTYGSWLYFTSPPPTMPGPSFVWRISTSGGALAQLGSTGSTPADGNAAFGAVDSTSVFLREGSGRIRKVPLSGATAEDLAIVSQPALFAGGLAINTTSVFFGDGNAVKRTPKSGGTVATVTSMGSQADLVTVLAANDADVYINQGLSTFAYDLKSGVLQSLDLGGRGVEALTIDGGGSIYAATTTGQIRVLAPGAAHSIVLAKDLYTPDAIAVEDPFVYWLDRGAYAQHQPYAYDTRMMKMATSGGSPVALATGKRLSGLAVGRRCVYWIADQTIMRVAR